MRILETICVKKKKLDKWKKSAIKNEKGMITYTNESNFGFKSPIRSWCAIK